MAAKSNLKVTGTEPQGYAESAALAALAKELKKREQAVPTYDNLYDGDLRALYDAIRGREAFAYNPNTDPLYLAGRDNAQKLGYRAMLDTIGNAAALTGGYGSSWAAAAGNQAYQHALSDLSGLLADTYDRAYTRYRDAGQDLYDQMALTQSLEASDYERYRDKTADYYEDLNYYYTKYNDMSEQEYAKYLDNIDLWVKNRDFQYQKEKDTRDYNYQAKKDTRDYNYMVEKDTRDFNYQKKKDTRDYNYQKKKDARDYKYQAKKDTRD